jgi:hypothetical protein
MMALTLWQPWAWAISDFSKRIENRPWVPPDWRRGQMIAIHAGATFDEAGAERIELDFGIVIPRDLPLKAIVAVARYQGFISWSDDPWFGGPYGWLLENVIKLDRPVMCRGHQGLWGLPSDIERAVLAQLADKDRSAKETGP